MQTNNPTDDEAVPSGGRGDLLRYAFARRLSRAEDPTRIHQVVVSMAASCTDAHLASLARYFPDQGHLKIVATAGYPVALVADLQFPIAQGILGRVFTTGRAMILSDVAALGATVASRPRYRSRACAAVPIMAGTKPIGVLTVADPRHGDRFLDSEILDLRRYVSIAALALEAADARRELVHLAQSARMDPLTGLFNRAYLFERLSSEIERARRHQTPLSLLMLDVDHFKEVNDTLGHQAGDIVLRDVASALRRTLRAFDVCCRIGGEEFVVILPASDARRGMRSAERIRVAVQALRVNVRADEALKITISGGLATLRDADSVGDFLHRADDALYRAKHGGRDRMELESS